MARLRGENIALKSEINELKARLKSGLKNALTKGQGDGEIPDFLKRAPEAGHA